MIHGKRRAVGGSLSDKMIERESKNGVTDSEREREREGERGREGEREQRNKKGKPEKKE